MNFRCDVRERFWVVPFVLCASLLLVATVWGQDPPAQQRQIKAETKVVVRISKDLVDDVVGRKEIVARVPYNAIVAGFHCRGVIDGRAKRSVEMTANNGDGMFFVNTQGTASTYARGVHGPIVAMGPACGPFTSRTVVRFDGKKFYRGSTTPWGQVNGHLQRLEGVHGTRVGRAVGRVLLPLGQHLVPRAEREATQVGTYLLRNFADGLAEDITSRLNRTTPVEASLNRLFPETTNWEIHLSTDPGYIQAAYGPPSSEVPVLPENPGRLKDMRMELWVRSTVKGAETLETLSKQPLAKPLIQAYLEATLPELAVLAEERSVTAVGSWVVICVGAPKTE